MHVYRLDLESLLPLLAEFQQDGSLSTMLPSGMLKRKGPCKARLDLLQGKVVYCHIEDNNRQVVYILDSRKIASTLYGLGDLDWQLDEGIDKLYSFHVDPYQTQPLPRLERTSGRMSPYQTQPLPHLERTSGQRPPAPSFPPIRHPLMSQTAQRLAVSELVPRAIATPDASILSSLSRNQRRVLVLVDGARSIKKITEILFSSPQNMRAVLQVLRELEYMGLVVIAG